VEPKVILGILEKKLRLFCLKVVISQWFDRVFVFVI
jgi:hypothetical protein